MGEGLREEAPEMVTALPAHKARARRHAEYDRRSPVRKEFAMKVLVLALVAALAGSSAAAADAPAAKPAAAPAAAASASPPKPSPGSELYFIEPADGATVSEVFKVSFGLSGMGVAPAGTLRDGTGHHHLFIDAKDPPKAGMTIPSDPKHVHFGGGQTETALALPPGDHTLQLVFGDASHQVFDPPLVSKKITVHVK
jgi:hypothetical protein